MKIQKMEERHVEIDSYTRNGHREYWMRLVHPSGDKSLDMIIHQGFESVRMDADIQQGKRVEMIKFLRSLGALE